MFPPSHQVLTGLDDSLGVLRGEFDARSHLLRKRRVKGPPLATDCLDHRCLRDFAFFRLDETIAKQRSGYALGTESFDAVRGLVHVDEVTASGDVQNTRFVANLVVQRDRRTHHG